MFRTSVYLNRESPSSHSCHGYYTSDNRTNINTNDKIFKSAINCTDDHLPTVMSRLDSDSLPLTYKLLESGMTVTLQVYVSEDVARSDGMSSLIVYVPAEAIMVVLLPPGPPSLPVTTTSLSTTVGSSCMVQVRVRGSPLWRITVASGSRLIASVGGGTIEICAT